MPGRLRPVSHTAMPSSCGGSTSAFRVAAAFQPTMRLETTHKPARDPGRRHPTGRSAAR